MCSWKVSAWETFPVFDKMRKLVMQNPILQFSKAAAQNDMPLLSDAFSASGLGAGLGQSLSQPSQADSTYAKAARRQRLLFGMMRFDMNKRGTI